MAPPLLCALIVQAPCDLPCGTHENHEKGVMERPSWDPPVYYIDK